MIARSGYTLLELLIALSILGVLLQMGLPSLVQMQRSREADVLMKTLTGHIALARSEAAIQGRIVTLCPSQDSVHCGGDWAQGSILFLDRNGDRLLNQDDRVLRVRHEEMPSGSLRWRAFGNRQALQIDARGFLLHQSGNFTYCDASGDATLNRQLVVNATGRVRMSTDTDGDGIVEDSRGRPLLCD